MAGPVALVGAGEFREVMDEFDRGLLEATGRSRPRVAVLPTASWPDDEPEFRRSAQLAVEHFASLGAEVEPIFVRDRADAGDAAAIQAVGEADLIYLCGGRSSHLVELLLTSPLGAEVRSAHQRGAVLAGCSAGASALAHREAEIRRRMLPFPIRWRDALNVVPGLVVLPYHDRWPAPLVAMVALQAPRGGSVLGIDEETAVVGRDGSWQVHGRGSVTVWHGRRRERFRAGEAFRI
ncbi:MAG: Type 1 glutamine amidotransferase-like domain-containing protein [Chloroflexota bacterium]